MRRLLPNENDTGGDDGDEDDVDVDEYMQMMVAGPGLLQWLLLPICGYCCYRLLMKCLLRNQ